MSRRILCFLNLHITRWVAEVGSDNEIHYYHKECVCGKKKIWYGRKDR